jgi:type IV pilus assembly protein PilF
MEGTAMKTPFRSTPRLARLVLTLLAAGAWGCATTSPQTIAENQRMARAHYNVAMKHLQEGRAGMAIRELQLAEALDPTDPWIELPLAEAYRLKGHDEEAEVHLKQALQLRPDLHAAKLNLSALYIQDQRYDEAIVLSKELLADATFPVPWKALTNEGYALYKLGRRAEARSAFDDALEYNESFWPARLDLAILDEDEGRHLEALAGLEKVLALNPGPMAEAEAHYRTATIYISLGNTAQALHHLTVASETRPSGEWGKRSADYLRRLR